MQAFKNLSTECYEVKSLSENDIIKLKDSAYQLGIDSIGAVVRVKGYNIPLTVIDYDIKFVSLIYGGILSRLKVEVKTIRFNKSSQKFETETFDHKALEEV